ncbi:MAG: thioesterase [Leptolyngbya sp. SIO4C1]|nr:thioesterase [Leptolyngbya sp. SIO4C1]
MSHWLVRPQVRSQPQLRLLCFAYAGGSAWIFRPWSQQQPDTVEVCAIELPGRGQRMLEPALTDLPTVIQSLGPELLPYLDCPFACFGHSLGALIAFELCRWLRRTVQLSPVQFWASAARAPHLKHDEPLMHCLSDADFIIALQRYNGTPPSILNHTEMMSLLLPTLRADFTLLETYQYQPAAPLDCPIVGLWGTQDPIVTQAEVAAWQAHGVGFSLQAVGGDHFFVQQPGFLEVLAGLGK